MVLSLVEKHCSVEMWRTWISTGEPSSCIFLRIYHRCTKEWSQSACGRTRRTLSDGASRHSSPVTGTKVWGRPLGWRLCVCQRWCAHLHITSSPLRNTFCSMAVTSHQLDTSSISLHFPLLCFWTVLSFICSRLLWCLKTGQMTRGLLNLITFFWSILRQYDLLIVVPKVSQWPKNWVHWPKL